MKVNRNIYINFFIALLSISSGMGTNPVMAGEKADPEKPYFNETLVILTDRNMYAVGEKILFKIYRSEKKNIEENWESKVVYIELLNAEGNTVKQAKYLLDADGTNGYFTIPEDILTGKYILLCYTNWMQNFSAAKFGGCLLKIINPYKAKLAPEGINNLKKIENSTNTLFFNPFNIQCQLSKNVYDRREKVEVDLLVPGDVKIADKIFCISVITKGAYNTY